MRIETNMSLAVIPSLLFEKKNYASDAEQQQRCRPRVFSLSFDDSLRKVINCIRGMSLESSFLYKFN